MVNGAQTIGSLAEAEKQSKKEVERVRVHLRLISLDKCPPQFSQDVTRSNNTQNAIQKRDFVALDPEQERYRRELSIDGVTYSFKAGEVAGDKAAYFDLTEATLAQVAANPDVTLPVQAKREIGKLWDDISKAPYKALFNPKVTGPELWEKVKILRTIQDALSAAAHNKTGRDWLISIHGNRFAEWLAYNRLLKNDKVDPEASAAIAGTALSNIIDEVKKSFGDSYPASLFKNATKCKNLAKALI